MTKSSRRGPDSGADLFQSEEDVGGIFLHFET